MPPGASASHSPVPCRVCRAEVTWQDLACPHCGAPRPARATYAGEGYEWKSRGTWMGSPLVHLAFGQDATGRLRTARGVVAIGQRAVGGLAIGIVACGVVSFGVVSVGLLAFGVVAVAAGAAVGVNAIGPVAYGVAAIGFLVGGLAPFGWRFWP